MKEIDIVYEGPNGKAWVYRDNKVKQYKVFRTGATHSTMDSAYSLDSNGLSIAIARAEYIDNKIVDK